MYVDARLARGKSRVNVGGCDNGRTLLRRSFSVNEIFDFLSREELDHIQRQKFLRELSKSY